MIINRLQKLLNTNRCFQILCIFVFLGTGLAIYAEQFNKYPLDTLYHRAEDLLPSLWERTELHPDLVTWEVIGVSSNEKLPIYGLRISNRNKGSEESKPSILFHGQHHSEEVIGVEIIFYMSRHFLSQYGKDRFITYLVDNYNLWFVPTMNPEGYRIVTAGQYRLKRKNNTDTNMNGIFEVRKDGVDLNRNYPFNWDKDENDDPESPYFKGHEPASQSENRAMIGFYERKRFQLAIFYHSSASGAYSERIYFPWRWGSEFSPDYEEMQHLANLLASRLPRNYMRSNYTVHQLNTSQVGFARDYIYSQLGTLAMLIEVGGNSPYGEGIISPPNNVLQDLKRLHTRAMIKMLEEYDKNLLIGRVVDTDQVAMKDREIIFDQKQNPYKRNLRTNREGYFFYYLQPGERPFNITIDNHEFAIVKEEDERIKFTFVVDPEEGSTLNNLNINNGEAIIMTNPVFQYFPAIKPDMRKLPDQKSLLLTLSEGINLLYQEEITEENGSFNLPWIPTDLTNIGILSIQGKNAVPLISKATDKIENKIVFLQYEQEILSFVKKYNRLNSWYLQPDTMLGVDYSLYPAGDNDYIMDEIRVIGNQEFRSNDLELILYDGGVVVYRTRGFRSENDYISFTIPDVPLPDNLFLVLANRGYHPLSIYQEGGYTVSSRRMFGHYSEWQAVDFADLAIEISLEKR